MLRNLPVTILLSLFALTASAEMYKWVDADGNTHYSDEAPNENAKPVELKPLPTMRMDKLKLNSKAATAVPAAATSSYDAVAIVSPANDTTIRNYDQPISVSTSTSPALRKGDAVRLLMDGQVVGAGTSGQFSIKTWNRGSHQLVAEIVTHDGQVLLSSATVTIHLHRTSVLNPNHPSSKAQQD